MKYAIILLSTGATAFAQLQVNVSGSNPGPITLESLSYSPGGQLYTDFIAPAAITSFMYEGSAHEVGLRSGNTFQSLNSYGGINPAFTGAIVNAFGDKNLNTYLDFNFPGDSKWSFILDLGAPLKDNVIGNDIQGEIFVTERGWGPGGAPGNSMFRLDAVDQLGNNLGSSYIFDSTNNVQLSPAKMSGSSAGEQPLGAQTIDISSAFGLSEVRYLKVSRLENSNLLAGRDAWPDFQMFGVQTIPEPTTTLGALFGSAMLLLRRRRSA